MTPAIARSRECDMDAMQVDAPGAVEYLLHAGRHLRPALELDSHSDQCGTAQLAQGPRTEGSGVRT